MSALVPSIKRALRGDFSLTFKKRIEGNFAAAASMSLLKAAQGSAHGAQKFKHETRLRSFERTSLKCSGEVISIRLDAIVVWMRGCLM